MWLACPAIVVRYRQVWDQLPERVATKFNSAGHATGWMTRQQSLNFNLELIAIMLAVFAIVLLVLRVRNAPSWLQWALLAAFWAQLGVMLFIFESVLDYSLYGKPVYTGPAIFAGPGAIVLLVLLFARQRRAPGLNLRETAARS